MSEDEGWITRLPEGTSPTRHRGVFFRRVLGSTVATLAVVTLLAGSYVYVFGLPVRSAPLPPLSLRWHPVAAPAGRAKTTAFETPPDVSPETIALAPSDGDIAYACRMNAPGSYPQIFVTGDRSAHWLRISELPVPVPAAGDAGCGLTVDSLNLKVVLAVVTRFFATVNETDTGFVSQDGGMHWSPVTNVEVAGQGFFTWRDAAYTVSNLSIYRSIDGMRTWQTIKGPARPAGTIFRQAWVDPAAGDLLLWEENMSSMVSSLWVSRDQGAHWQSLHVPNMSFVYAQQPESGHTMLICGVSVVAWRDTLHIVPSGVWCSGDSGYTWSSYPAPRPSSRTLSIYVWGISSSGDLIAEDQLADGASSLLRLETAENQWQTLGALPGAANVLEYTATPGPGVLWSVPVDNGNGPPPPAVYSADYPQVG